MLKKVVSVTFNKEYPKKDGSGTYTCTAFVSEDATGKADREERFFGKETFYNVVKDLSVGDYVDIKKVQEGKFWNIADIKLVAKQGEPTPTGWGEVKKPFGSSGFTARAEDPNKQIYIVRQSSLGHATNLINMLISKDAFAKKAVTTDFLTTEIMRLAAKYELFVMGNITPNTPVAGDDSPPFELPPLEIPKE
jgi:hypothetical protein